MAKICLLAYYWYVEFQMYINIYINIILGLVIYFTYGIWHSKERSSPLVKARNSINENGTNSDNVPYCAATIAKNNDINETL